MTREEAITIIDNLHLIGCGRNQHEDDIKTNIAIDMAIEALSADADCSTCKHKDKDWDSEECDSCCGNNNHYASADADGEDLIIKGAKGIQDGLYNIKDGKLFKYKANGGTVRTYPIVPSADAVQGWIPCSERLPKINQRVLLATNEERVFVGYKEKPDIVWRVTEADGREHWVYDPENYTDDIDVLPKDEDCGFAKDDVYADGFLSVTSINYDDRFEGVIAWMPLPKPYKGGDTE